MTAHTCKTLDPNCYRCDLNKDEMKPDRMTDTNKLRKLLAAATPLPWQEVVTRHERQGTCIESAGLDEIGCPARVVDASCSGMEGGGFVRAEDLHLVVAATNALPAMLDELDAARAEVERLRDMLARLCGAVEHSAPRYGVDEDWVDDWVDDWADIDTLRLRLDEAKALLAKHKETDQ